MHIRYKRLGSNFFLGLCAAMRILSKQADFSRRLWKNGHARDLAGMMLRLQKEGAHNIDLVTPTQFAEGIRSALIMAKEAGLMIPVVYNCGGYEDVCALRRLKGLIDVWLPDFKYISGEISQRYSSKADYPEKAKAALSEMVRQAGRCAYDENGLMVSGVLVRHLVLPAYEGGESSPSIFISRIRQSHRIQYLKSVYTAAVCKGTCTGAEQKADKTGI